MEMNFSMLLLDEPTNVFAGTFTRNQFPGAPVYLCRDRLNNEKFQGILINNKIANVCIETGLDDSEQVLKVAAQQLGCDPSFLMASSTGVIGWRLPVEKMKEAVPELVKSTVNDSEKNAYKLSKHIMTTDSFPKLRSRTLPGGGRIVAVAKGAGMIEPNMATMLCFVMTDLAVSRETLRAMLPGIVSKTFNRISVDSDQSTSDMVIAASSALVPCDDTKLFENALFEVCSELASDIVRNGEGTSHVIKVKVSGAETEEQASSIGKALVNSPLVKTAIAGNDPNVGRFISSVGDYCGNAGIDIPVRKLELHLGGSLIFSEGAFRLTPQKEKELSEYLKNCSYPAEHKGWPVNDKTVDIEINLGIGESVSIITGSDLTHEYVSENADYRS